MMDSLIKIIPSEVERVAITIIIAIGNPDRVPTLIKNISSGPQTSGVRSISPPERRNSPLEGMIFPQCVVVKDGGPGRTMIAGW
jgi:hypothetical protein